MEECDIVSRKGVLTVADGSCEVELQAGVCMRKVKLGEELVSGLKLGALMGVKPNRERGSIQAPLFEVRHMIVTFPLCSFLIAGPLSS